MLHKLPPRTDNDIEDVPAIWYDFRAKTVEERVKLSCKKSKNFTIPAFLLKKITDITSLVILTYLCKEFLAVVRKEKLGRRLPSSTPFKSNVLLFVKYRGFSLYDANKALSLLERHGYIYIPHKSEYLLKVSLNWYKMLSEKQTKPFSIEKEDLTEDAKAFINYCKQMEK